MTTLKSKNQKEEPVSEASSPLISDVSSKGVPESAHSVERVQSAQSTPKIVQPVCSGATASSMGKKSAESPNKSESLNLEYKKPWWSASAKNSHKSNTMKWEPKKLCENQSASYKPKHSPASPWWKSAPSPHKPVPPEQHGVFPKRSGDLGVELPGGTSRHGPVLVQQSVTVSGLSKHDSAIPASRLVEIGANLWNSLPRPLTPDSTLQAARALGVPMRIRSYAVDPDTKGGWQLRVEERSDTPKALLLHDPANGEGALLPNLSRYGPFQDDYEFGMAMPTDNFVRIGNIAIGSVDESGRYITTTKGRLHS